MTGSSLLDKYRSPADRLFRTEEAIAGEPYTAFQISTETVRRISFNPARDASRLTSYGQLIDILHAADSFITFLFHHGKIEIEGENLGQLIAMLQEDRVKSLDEFVPGFHQEQPEGAPVITKMTISDSLTKQPQHLATP